MSVKIPRKKSVAIVGCEKDKVFTVNSFLQENMGFETALTSLSFIETGLDMESMYDAYFRKILNIKCADMVVAVPDYNDNFDNESLLDIVLAHQFDKLVYIYAVSASFREFINREKTKIDKKKIEPEEPDKSRVVKEYVEPEELKKKYLYTEESELKSEPDTLSLLLAEAATKNKDFDCCCRTTTPKGFA